MSLREITPLYDEIVARPFRGVLKQDLLQALFSSVNPVGWMYTSTPASTFTGNGTWKRFDQWEGSVDTKGVQDQLGSSEGSFLIKPNGGGDYIAATFLRFQISSAGDVRLRPRHELAGGDSESFLHIDRDTFGANAPGCFLFAGNLKKGFVENDKITTELYVDSGTTLTPKYGFFFVLRV